MMELIKKSQKILLVIITLTVSSSLYSLEESNNCSDIFIQVPYTTNKSDELSYSDARIIIHPSYPVMISYRSIFNDNTSTDLWNLRLKTQKDAALLFINLMGKSHLSFDDSIWAMLQLIMKLKERHQFQVAGSTESFLADILGMGDVFDAVTDIIRFSSSEEWISTMKYWSKYELEHTYWEFTELKSVVHDYLTQIAKNQPEGLKTIYKIDTALKERSSSDLDENHLASYKELLKRMNRFRNISSIIGSDKTNLIAMIILGIRSQQEDLLFWKLYTEKLLEKTGFAIDKAIDKATLFTEFLSKRSTSSMFLQDRLSDLSILAQDLIDYLHDLKRKVKNSSDLSFFKDMPYAHVASSTELLKYIRAQSSNIFSHVDKMSEDPRYLVGTLDQKLNIFFTSLQSSYNLILKDNFEDTRLSTRRNMYFTDFSYLTTNPDYLNFLIDKYGNDFVKKIQTLVARSIDQTL